MLGLFCFCSLLTCFQRFQEWSTWVSLTLELAHTRRTMSFCLQVSLFYRLLNLNFSKGASNQKEDIEYGSIKLSYVSDLLCIWVIELRDLFGVFINLRCLVLVVPTSDIFQRHLSTWYTVKKTENNHFLRCSLRLIFWILIDRFNHCVCMRWCLWL